MQTLVLSLALLALVASVAWHAVDVLWERRLMLRRRVLVQLKSGVAIEGLLWSRRRRIVVLRDAMLYEPGAEPKPMDGAALIERAEVDYTQVPG